MNNVDAFTQPGTFTLEQFLVDASYPTESIVIYRDAHAVNEYLKLSDERNKISADIAAAEEARRLADKQRTVGADPTVAVPDTDDLIILLDELDKKMSEWDDKVAKSGLTFELQGMPPAVVDAITKKHFPDRNKDYTNTPEEDERDFELIALTVVSVTDPAGNKLTQFGVDDVKRLKGVIIEGQYEKLIQRVAHVNLNGALFDQATDASFLGGRSHVAG